MLAPGVLIAMFAVATAVAVAARRLRVPYTVALVAAGLALGATHALAPPHLTQELLYDVFLPGLLFEAAFHLPFRRFWGNVLAIGGLAVPGIVLSGLLMAPLLAFAVARLHVDPGFGFVHGLLFAALIGATDPIAVVALFRALGVPQRLATLVEGESLFNDGTAVAFYTVVLAAMAGAHPSVGSAVAQFFALVGGGLVVGVLVGWIVSRLLRHLDDAMVEITLTTIAAYGSFVGAEALHVSGVIATVAAGMMCGSYGARVAMSPSTRLAVTSFWEYVAFALNSIVFLLIGFEVTLTRLLASWRVILVAYVVVTVVRALLVASMTLAVRPTRERLPWRWGVVLGWGGLRGALSMVLALGLPRELGARDLIVTMTFGVVVLTILVQGLTMQPLLRWLGLEQRAGADGPTSPGSIERWLERRRIVAEKAALLEAERQGLATREEVAKRMRDCDERLVALDDEPHP